MLTFSFPFKAGVIYTAPMLPAPSSELDAYNVADVVEAHFLDWLCYCACVQEPTADMFNAANDIGTLYLQAYGVDPY